MAVHAQSETLPGVPFRHKLSWGAIFGGTLTGLACWILLLCLGLALGLTSVDPGEANTFSARAVGLTSGLWAAVTGFIAMFVGAWVAARTCGPVDRLTGILHGAVLWGVSTTGMVLAVWMGLSGLVSGLAGAGKTVAQASAGAASAVPGQGALTSLGVNYDDLVAPLNQRLRAEGKPTVTAQQLQAATRDVVNDALKQGRLDRDLLTGSIAQQTALSQQDASELAGRLETSFNEKSGQVTAQVKAGAQKAADVTGKVFWGVFFAFLIDLVCALLGAALGMARRREARTVTAVRAPEPVPPTTGPVIPGRGEVYT
ncbi:MAG TPA: hypothetical protein VK447_05005 [Myxococcaceae bacterium]|nr:hypothetical protein [Myxococcaceae bacterium]